MAFCPGTPKWESENCPETVLKLSRFGLSGLWQLIAPCSDLWSGWGLNQTCSSPWELSNGVFHSACTHRGRVDSRLLVVGSQIASLTPDPFFDHNLCCRCPNDSCEAILDIYTSRRFQRYKEHLKARCFDPCNRTLNFWESRRTLKSHFRECEWRSHTSLKVGLRQQQCLSPCKVLKGEFAKFCHVYDDGCLVIQSQDGGGLECTMWNCKV